jgi:hypothetical protein
VVGVGDAGVALVGQFLVFGVALVGQFPVSGVALVGQSPVSDVVDIDTVVILHPDVRRAT